MKKTVRYLCLPISVMILIVVFLYIVPTKEERGIYNKIIRLHVIASSDSEEDQALKLKVRDSVLNTVTEFINDCEEKDDAERIISNNISKIKSAAQKTVYENNSSYPVKVELSTEKYPTKEYGEVKLPSGEYCSLRVMIGEAKGKNWWCVLFPPLCTGTSAVSDKFVSAGFTPGEVKILTESESPKYVLKFRILEIIGNLFS